MTSTTKTHLEVYFRKVTAEQQNYMPDSLKIFVYRHTLFFFVCPFSGFSCNVVKVFNMHTIIP